MRSANESEALSSFLGRTDTWYWIGLYQPDTTERDAAAGWERVAESCAGVEFSGWTPQQPDNLGMQDCAVVAPRTAEWFDAACSGWHGCVCEAGLAPTAAHRAWIASHDAAQLHRSMRFGLTLIGVFLLPTFFLCCFRMQRRRRDAQEGSASADNSFNSDQADELVPTGGSLSREGSFKSRGGSFKKASASPPPLQKPGSSKVSCRGLLAMRRGSSSAPALDSAATQGSTAAQGSTGSLGWAGTLAALQGGSPSELRRGSSAAALGSGKNLLRDVSGRISWYGAALGAAALVAQVDWLVPVSVPNETAEARLRRLKATAESQRWLVSLLLLQVGWALLLLGALPLGLAAGQIALPYGIGDVVGWVPLMPVGSCLILLAVLPTDHRIIRGLCHAAPVGMLLLGGNEAVMAARLWAAGSHALAVPVAALAALWLPSLAALLPTLRSPKGGAMSGGGGRHGAARIALSPRLQLHRLWKVLRGYLVAAGVAVLCSCVGLTLHNRAWVGDPLFRSALGLATSCLLCAAASHPKLRRRALEQLGKLAQDGEARQAAAVAGMIGGLGRSDALGKAKELFRALPFEALGERDLIQSGVGPPSLPTTATTATTAAAAAAATTTTTTTTQAAQAAQAAQAPPGAAQCPLAELSEVSMLSENSKVDRAPVTRSVSRTTSRRDRPSSHDNGSQPQVQHTFRFAVGARVRHPARGPGTVTELMEDGRTRVKFDDQDDEHRYNAASVLKLKPLGASDEADAIAALAAKTVKVNLCRADGRPAVDAFMSHSWSDDGVSKYAALCEWAAEFHAATSRQPQLWLDKACIPQTSIDASLAVLPIFLSGCVELLVIAGPSYPTRLWCIMELFTFLWMGGSLSRITVKPIGTGMHRSEGELRREQTELTRSLLHEFDVANATCFKQEERQRLLGVIEAAFGDFAAFNRLAQETFAQRLDFDLSETSMAATAKNKNVKKRSGSRDITGATRENSLEQLRPPQEAAQPG